MSRFKGFPPAKEWLGPLGLLLALIFLSLFIYSTPYLRLSQIDCVSLEADGCPEVVWAELNHLKNKQALLTDVKQLETKITSALPGVREVEATVKLPNRLKVELKPEYAVAAVRRLSSQPGIVVSSQMVMIKAEEGESLAVVVYPDLPAITPGESLRGETIESAFSLLGLLLEQRIIFQRIIIDGEVGIKVPLENSYEAWFSSQRDLSRQVTTLQSILLKATMIEGVEIIDLRFNPPVLKPAT